ncbi:hypothetical protein TNCV_4218651 [Trichonephila clavipes]|nr:hypothetical protein TNCV_4218651 [Trichonephila clavipes]
MLQFFIGIQYRCMFSLRLCRSVPLDKYLVLQTHSGMSESLQALVWLCPSRHHLFTGAAPGTCLLVGGPSVTLLGVGDSIVTPWNSKPSSHPLEVGDFIDTPVDVGDCISPFLGVGDSIVIVLGFRVPSFPTFGARSSVVDVKCLGGPILFKEANGLIDVLS